MNKEEHQHHKHHHVHESERNDEHLTNHQGHDHHAHMINDFKMRAEESNEQYEREIKSLIGEKTSLEIKIGQLEKDNHRMRNMTVQKSSEAEMYTAELTALVEKKKKEIRQLEDANGKLRIRVQVLERTVEESKFEKKDSRGETKQEMDKFQLILKQQLAESESKVRQLKG